MKEIERFDSVISVTVAHQKRCPNFYLLICAVRAKVAIESVKLNSYGIPVGSIPTLHTSAKQRDT